MNRLNTNAVADALTARVGRTTSAAIVDFQQFSQTLARVAVSLNTNDTTRENKFNAVCAAFGNKARPIETSFREVASYGNPAMVGWVVLNRETKPYEEVAAKKMKALSSNMLMDTSDDSLWEVKHTASGQKMLARQQMDNLAELLVTARVRQPRAPKLDDVKAGVDRGTFVSFVDPSTDTVRYGYVVATDLSITPMPNSPRDIDTDNIEVLILPQAPENNGDETTQDGGVAERIDYESATVHSSLVIEVAYMNDNDRHAEVAMPTNSQSTEAMKQYYADLYKNWAPEYYADVVRQIEDHSGL
jgi:hypothetical protein